LAEKKYGMRKGDILRKLKHFWWNIIKVHSAKERATKTERNNKKNMSCNLTQSRTEYRRKMMAHKAAKKAEKESKMYKPNKKKTYVLSCRYCKEEGHKVGHFDKVLGRFVTTCVKALEANERKAKFNKRKRDAKSDWKSEVSESVATDTGVGGWSTAGSKDKTSVTRKVEKPVLKFAKNRFDIPEDDSEEDEERVAAAAAAAAERERVEIRRKRLEAARLAAEQEVPKAVSAAEPQGAWAAVVAAPAKVELVRAERKTWTPTNSDSSGEETGAKQVEMYVPKRWGDDEEDNSAW
jgi:hypothetical protein